MNDGQHGAEYWRRARAVEVNPGEHACPVCAETMFEEGGSYDICKICGWEDDPVQAADPDFAGGANRESLNQARATWEARKTNR